jgi:hypothetical protein
MTECSNKWSQHILLRDTSIVTKIFQQTDWNKTNTDTHQRYVEGGLIHTKEVLHTVHPLTEGKDMGSFHGHVVTPPYDISAWLS